MAKKLILLLTLWSLFFHAQKKADSTLKPSKKVHVLSVDLLYGNSIYVHNFYNQVNSFNKVQFNLPIKQVGFGLSNINQTLGYANQYQITWQTSFSSLLKNKLEFNDTITTEISGFSYSLAFGHVFFRKSKYLKLTTYVGFNTGRSILTKLNNLNLKNSFFAPKLLLQPKVIFRRICFSLFIDYCYDISDKKWNKLKQSNTPFHLNNFDQSNLTLLFSIGFCPFKYQ